MSSTLTLALVDPIATAVPLPSRSRPRVGPLAAACRRSVGGVEPDHAERADQHEARSEDEQHTRDDVAHEFPRRSM